MNKNNQLKPCPFCGSEKVYILAIKEKKFYEKHVHCDNCKTMFTLTHDNLLETLTEAWNRRANE